MAGTALECGPREVQGQEASHVRGACGQEGAPLLVCSLRGASDAPRQVRPSVPEPYREAPSGLEAGYGESRAASMRRSVEVASKSNARMPSDQRLWSGRRDSNPRPPPWQGYPLTSRGVPVRPVPSVCAGRCDAAGKRRTAHCKVGQRECHPNCHHPSPQQARVVWFESRPRRWPSLLPLRGDRSRSPSLAPLRAKAPSLLKAEPMMREACWEDCSDSSRSGRRSASGRGRPLIASPTPSSTSTASGGRSESCAEGS
jgi:hypothetical protein